MALTVGVDVGGTKIAAGVVDDEGRILARVRRATVGQPGDAEEDIAQAVAELAAVHPVTAVGIGAAGFTDETRSVVRFAANLGWRERPVGRRLAEMTGLPVVVENDANAAAWGEHRFGAAREHDDVVMVTVGTGIGGGLILDGELYRGRFGVAGEFGHLVVVPDGRPCGCGRRGCWEQYASGSALLRAARGRAADDRSAAAVLLAMGDGTPEGILGAHVTTAAYEDDPVALASFGDIAHWLGRGMAELASVVDPGSFVIGGGVSEAGELLLRPAREAYEAHLVGAAHRPAAQVLLAALGNDAGLIGAADLARH